MADYQGRPIGNLSADSIKTRMLQVTKLNPLMDNATPAKNKKMTQDLIDKLEQSDLGKNIKATKEAADEQKDTQRKLASSIKNLNKTLRDMMGGRGGGGGAPPPGIGGGGGAGDGGRGFIKKQQQAVADTYQNGMEQGITGFLKRASRLFAMYRLGDQIWGGAIADNVKFMVGMRQTLYATEGLTAASHGLQKEWEDLSDVTSHSKANLEKMEFSVDGLAKDAIGMAKNFGDVGVSIARMEDAQKVHLKYLQRGMRNMQDEKKILRSTLALDKMINVESGTTADMFADWHQHLMMSSTDLHAVSLSMQQIQRQSGLSGQAMVEVAKSSEQFMKNMRNASTLSAQATDSIMRLQAEFKKRGIEDATNGIMNAITSANNLFMRTDRQTQSLVMMAAQRGGVLKELMAGVLPNDPKAMAKFVQGLQQSVMQVAQGAAGPRHKVTSFEDIENLPDQVKMRVNMALEGAFGRQSGELKQAVEGFKEGAKTFGDRLEDLKEKLKAVNGQTELEAKYKQQIADLTKAEQAKVTAAFIKSIDKTKDFNEAMKMFGKDMEKYEDVFKEMGITAKDAGERMEQFMTKQMEDLSKQLQEKGLEIPKLLNKDLVKQAMKDARSADKATSLRGKEMLKGMQEAIQKSQETLGVAGKAGADPISDMQNKLDAVHNRFMKWSYEIIDTITKNLGGHGLFGAYLGMLGISMLPEIYNLLKGMMPGGGLLGGGGFGAWTGAAGNAVGAAIGGAIAGRITEAFTKMGLDKIIPDEWKHKGLMVDLGGNAAGMVAAFATGGLIGVIAYGVTAIAEKVAKIYLLNKQKQQEYIKAANESVARQKEVMGAKDASAIVGEDIGGKLTQAKFEKREKHLKNIETEKAAAMAGYGHMRAEAIDKGSGVTVSTGLAYTQAATEKHQELSLKAFRIQAEEDLKTGIIMPNGKERAQNAAERADTMVRAAMNEVFTGGKPGYEGVFSKLGPEARKNIESILRSPDPKTRDKIAEQMKSFVSDKELKLNAEMEDADAWWKLPSQRRGEIYNDLAMLMRIKGDIPRAMDIAKMIDEQAPRKPPMAHSGGLITGQGNVPIIARGGEGILTPQQMESVSKALLSIPLMRMGTATPLGPGSDYYDRLRQDRATKAGPTETHSDADDKTAQNTETTNQKLDKLIMLFTMMANKRGSFAPPNGKMMVGDPRGNSVFGLPIPHWMEDLPGTYMDSASPQTLRDMKT